MSKKNAIAFIALLLLFAGYASAAQPELFYKSNLFVKLNEETFSPGETLEATIELLNMEDFPIAEAYVVVELVQGDDYYYPSQMQDTDNIFFEEKITGLNIAPHEKVSETFSYNLPSGLKPGNYRIDVYAKTNKTSLVGAPHIFASPNSVRFAVSGVGNEFPEAKFIRTKTMFHEFLGPVGPGIKPGEEIENGVFVQNISGKSLSNVILFVGLCEWDDTSCASYESTATEKIALLAPGEEKAVSVKLKAPQMPDAYAIRLELRDSSGRLLSLYRNRSIVYGGTAKIHQLNISDYSFEQGSQGEISMFIGPSPDHYNFPPFEDFTVKAWIENARDNNRVIFSDERQVASIASPDFLTFAFPFTAEKALDLFKVCGSVSKGGEEHEHYCYLVDASKFPKKELASEIAIEWNYDFSNRTLNLLFSNEDTKLKEMNAAFMLLRPETSELVATKALKGESPVAESIAVEPENFVLLLNNFSTRKQQKVEINIVGREAAFTLKSCPELGGSMCSEGQLCDNPAASSEGKWCCLTQCRGRASTSQQSLPWGTVYSLLLWVAAIVVILVIAYNAYVRFGGRGNEEFGGENIENDLR
ncbi:MAG: hypothetical protein WC634_00830 [archaeon]